MLLRARLSTTLAVQPPALISADIFMNISQRAVKVVALRWSGTVVIIITTVVIIIATVVI